MKGYDERDVNLAMMGYSSYEEYLDSDLWQTIRLRVLERDNHLCRVCDKPERPAACVHHTSYAVSVLKGEDISSLYSLCHGHHLTVEFDSTVPGRKLHLKSVVKKTARHLKFKDKKRRPSKPWIGLKHKKKRNKNR